MPRRLVVQLFLLAAGCTPAPRWIAVAVPPDHAILLFDGALHPAGRLDMPGAPTALETTGDGMSLLAGTSSGPRSGSIVWLDRTDGTRILAAGLRGPARDIVVTNDGNAAFVLTTGDPGGVSVRGTRELNEQRWIAVCAQPLALAFTREGDQGYVTCASGTVAEVDPALEYLVRRAFVAADSGRACGAGRSALSPNGTLLFVPCAATGRLLYVDRVTLEPWDSAEVGVGISAVAAARGGVAVVLQPDSDRLVLVDLARHAGRDTVATPANPVAVVLSADGRLAFVASAGRGESPGALLELDAGSGAILARAALPPGASAVYVWPGQTKSRMHWEPGGGRVASTGRAARAQGVPKGH